MCLRGASIVLVVDERTGRYLMASIIKPVYLSDQSEALKEYFTSPNVYLCIKYSPCVTLNT